MLVSIIVENVSFTYQKGVLLEDLNFSVRPREIVSLIGGSGSGKTTIFKLLNGLISPTQGKISVAGGISYMMQEDMLLPWRTVLKNITLTCELGKNCKNYLSPQAIIEELALKGCENDYPSQLSGGMRQRVALGRALLQNRPILLLDEPFGSLDVFLREQLYALLRKLRDIHGTTIMMVTHDFHDALALSDRILFLAKGSIQKQWQLDDSNRYSDIFHDIRKELMKFAGEVFHPCAF